MLPHCLTDVQSRLIWRHGSGHAAPLPYLFAVLQPGMGTPSGHPVVMQMSHSKPAVGCAAGSHSGLPNALPQLSAACSAWFRGWLNQRSSMTGASTSLGRLQPPCAVDQKVLHDIVGALYKHSISLSNEVSGRLRPSAACE